MYSLCMAHIWPMYDLYMAYIFNLVITNNGKSGQIKRYISNLVIPIFSNSDPGIVEFIAAREPGTVARCVQRVGARLVRVAETGIPTSE